ncbi:hypothetical protein BDZ90DRAFT_231334 [Jaminaea rosea]|uniref:Pericentrin/AKAP-450 centrosomal targeting domain-containing protein n=1 Tax=Jaminaea rosea TaxID=1569628 RepID=A0A316UYW7_9BASI|nr:hypothetical protein BDZ90DRAFT_231334 [Jaminaea rosea]PWN28345.1 hypothetical protein BDZ90DRAFT_231334 [Jaminaea rosea]
MNGSFESPSHLERRIRAEIEDAEESSLSAPGFGRRARSESLSFRTDEGSQDGERTTSYHPSTHRILPDLSELNNTPTAARTRTTQTLAGVLDRQQQRRQSRNDVSQENQQKQPHGRSQDSNAQSQRPFARFGGSVSESGSFHGRESRDSGNGEGGPRDSLPLTSTPQKTGCTHRSQTTFYSQKSNEAGGSGGNATGRQGAGSAALARRAAESAARDATRQSATRSSRDDEGTGSAWSSGRDSRTRDGSRPLSNQDDLSVGTIDSIRQDRPVTASAAPADDAESSREDTTRVSEAETSAQPTEGMQPPISHQRENEPSGAFTEDKSQATPTRPVATSLATPRANAAVTADRMQSYVLSAFKDPVRELRVQQSLRTQRVRPQRVPLAPSEESSIVEPTPATDKRMNRLGRSMKLGAGRTPLPARVQSDAASQASEQSSTYDLMTPAKGWANTSLPGIGLQADNAAQATNRIDPNKLSRHLHKLNGGLVEENAELKAAAASAQSEVETLRRQLNVALREKEKAQRQLANQSRVGDNSDDQRSPANIPLPPSPAPGDSADHEEREQALQEALEKIEELEGHKEELNDMLDALESEHENLRGEMEQLKQRRVATRNAGNGDESADQTQGSAALSERDVLLNDLEADLKRCEEEIQVRDEELQQAHEQLQASEEHRARLQDEVEEAANFAMQETGRFEEERDAAIKEAEDYKGEVDRLTQQVEKLEIAAQGLRAERASKGDADDEEAQRLREELDDARAIHAEEKAELEDLLKGHEMDLQAMEDERKDLEEQIRKLTEEADEVRDEMDRQRIAVDEKQNEILKLNRLLSGSDSTAKELADVREQLSKAKAEASETRAQAMELEQLKKQKVDLEARLESYKQQVQAHSSFSIIAGAAAAGKQDGAAHQSQTSSMLQTPAKHRALAALQTPIRTPRSPGQLSPASWLNHDSSLGNTSVVEHIKQLEELLAAANAQLDEKLSEIDRQGVSHLTLSRKLFEALDRIEELEAELRRRGVSRRDEDAADFTFASATTMNLDRKARSQQRDQALAEFVEKIPQLTARLAEMEEENKVLRNAQSKVNKAGGGALSKGKSKTTRKELHSTAHAELARAREAIADLDDELHAERRRLSELARDSKAYGEVSTAAERDLARTEQRLRSIENELTRKASDYAELQQEVADKSSVGGDETNGEMAIQLRVLESQARQAAKELQHLREDRAAVLETRITLHSQIRSATERHALVQAELASTRQAAQEHQQQLDAQTRQVEQLHTELRRQDKDLRKVAGDRDRLHEERRDILEDVAALEADLRRVRGESEKFGMDLERLRRERDEQRRQAERAGSAPGAGARNSEAANITAEAQETIAALKRRLDQAQRMIQDLEVRESLAATMGPTAHQDTAALRAKHAAECKGLLTQIRYLKAKYMRESDLREDLCFQKTYLLQMVGGLELSERETLRFLADLGRSRGIEQPERSMAKEGPRMKLRKALLVVKAASRMKCMAQHWRQTVAVKQALVQAHQSAKSKRRAGGASSSSDREGDREGFEAKLAGVAR